MTIGEKIKSLREEMHMTQDELGKACNVTKQTIFKYESGIITNIPLDRLELIANALNVPAAFLMGWESREDILIHCELQMSHGALTAIRRYARVFDRVTGLCEMDAMNALLENPKFDEIVQDILFQCTRDEETFVRLTKQYNADIESGKAKGKLVTVEEFKEMSYINIAISFNKLVHEIVEAGLTPFHEIENSGGNLNIRLTEENKYLHKLIRNERNKDTLSAPTSELT